MGLRDIALLIAIYGSIPFILNKPFVGILVWYWLGLMSPHRISWTLANKPVAMVIGLVMIFSIIISRKDSKKIPWTPITITLAIFWFWMFLTTVFAFYPSLAWGQWDKVWKIMLTTFIAIMLLNSKERILALVTVAGISMGFWGFKGGLFTVLSGGSYRVWGPPGSFVSDNNAMALAVVMTIPILAFLRSVATYRIVKIFLLVAIVLCVFSALGSQSRGGLLGLISIGTFFALKSRHKAQYLLLVAILAPVGFQFMPEGWHQRMNTIETYEEDRSAMGRITAWKMATNLALHQPLGGGFEAFRPPTYLMYLPEAGARGTDAHSIWFEILGEQGFIGLILYITLGSLTFFTCSRIIRLTKRDADLKWMSDLAAMVQVSIVAYASTGTFLGLAYFDYFYLLVAIVVGLTVVMKQALPDLGSSLQPMSDSTRPTAGVKASTPTASSPTTAGSVIFSPSPERLWQDLTRWYARL